MPQFCLRITSNDLVFLGFPKKQLMLFGSALVTEGNLELP